MTTREIVGELRALGNPINRDGMARFGINVESAFGVSVKEIRRIGKRCGHSHELAAELWATGIHEARILASIVDDPSQITAKQMDDWVRDFNSWDLCDQCCGNLFEKTRFAWSKIPQWCRRHPEFQRRAGFALIASLAWHDKIVPDENFLKVLPLIEQYADDDRNFVRKSVNWALRNIGKRNAALHEAAVSSAQRILEAGSKSGRWIARDALRELA